MRTVHWLFLVSVALFVTGIGFLLASARVARQQPAPVEAPATTPVATIKQIMQGITMPAANVVFQSVSTTISHRGIEEKRPEAEEEWQVVGNAAAALIESGNLLMLGSRLIDKEDWIKMSKALMDASAVALKATEEKNVEKLLDSGEAINAACDSCHQKYQK